MKQTTWLKGLVVLIAVLLLSACSNNPETSEAAKTDESQIETAIEQDLSDQESSEEKSNEQEQSTEEGETEGVYFSEEFLSKLKKGQMPGSEIQFTNSIEDVKNILGEPDSIEELEGGEVLKYETYGYVHGYGSSSDRISAIFYYISNEEGVTGEDFANAWGEPQEKGEIVHPNPAYVMNYHLNDNYVVSLEMDNSQQGIVKFFVLSKIGN